MRVGEWRRCDDPAPMLRHLGRGASARKRRLFVVACCRRLAHLLVHEASRDAVEVAEQFADGLASDGERQQAFERAYGIYQLISHAFIEPLREESPSFAEAIITAGVHPYAATDAAEAAAAVVDLSARWLDAQIIGAVAAGWAAATGDHADDAARTSERAAQAALVRDIFGDTFSAPALDRARLTPAVASIARAAYEARALPSGHLDADRLAVLADALEEAGCADEAILGHLRSPGPHVRGCRALDLVLGKS